MTNHEIFDDYMKECNSRIKSNGLICSLTMLITCNILLFSLMRFYFEFNVVYRSAVICGFLTIIFCGLSAFFGVKGNAMSLYDAEKYYIEGNDRYRNKFNIYNLLTQVLNALSFLCFIATIAIYIFYFFSESY